MESVPNLESGDYYENLGVPRDATRADIKNAYRVLAIKHHPDTNVGNAAAAEIKFILVGEAYHVLSTPQLRSVYDESGKERLETMFTMEKARKVFQDFHRFGPEVGPNAPSVLQATGGALVAATSGVGLGNSVLLAGAAVGVVAVAVGVGGMVYNIGLGIAEIGQASALAVQKKRQAMRDRRAGSPSGAELLVEEKTTPSPVRPPSPADRGTTSSTTNTADVEWDDDEAGDPYIPTFKGGLRKMTVDAIKAPVLSVATGGAKF